MCSRQRWTRPYVPISLIAAFRLRCCMQAKWGLPWRRKNRNWLWYKGPWKDPCWEYCWAHMKWGNLGAEQSGGCDCGVSKFPVDRTCHRQKVDLYIYWVVSKRQEMTTQKAFTMIENETVQQFKSTWRKGIINNKKSSYI